MTTLRSPCHNCPFRSDRPFHGLRRQKAEGVVSCLMGDRPFHCHKTTKKPGLFETVVDNDSRPCVGALIFMQKVRPNGAIGNIWVRLGTELKQPGFALDDLDPDAPVCSSVEEFYRQSVIPNG